MPLTLVTGPANAEKAGVVLGAYRAAIDRSPLLVVPTAADVDRYRRELAAEGVVFGARVLTFAWLVEELAARAGVRGRPLGPVARERVAAAAVARTELRVLGPAARAPGFARALLGLCDELEGLRVDPARWYAAVRAWAAAEPGRAAYAEDLAALYRAYRRGLEALGRLDAPLIAAAALDGLRLQPRRWGATPVCFYGFDDFTAPQLDAIETLAAHAGADVTVSLAYEPGRAAFAGPAPAFEELRRLASEHVEVAASAEHYAPDARDALHHVERSLFEPGAGAVDDADGVLLLEGGGERAELELAGAEIARLLGAGVAAEEIAVVVRDPARAAALIGQVFDAYEIGFALERSVRAAHTAVGRGLIALVRCSLLAAEATADDLLALLRTPGLLRVPALADRLERDLRRGGKRDLAAARARWEEQHWPLEVLDRVARAGAEGPAALCAALAAELDALFAAPHRRAADVLAGPEILDAQVTRALGGALRELGAVAVRDAALMPGPAGLERLLGEVDVRVGDRPGPGRVTVCDPLAIRARRVRALFACGLQEGAFPRPGRPEPFLSDAERRALNTAAGLRLRPHEDRLDRERTLFYAAVSRPTDLLVLGWHAADEDGDPAVRSLFVDDVLDLFATPPPARVRRLGDAGWPAPAPTAREEELAAAAAAEGEIVPVIEALSEPRVLEHLQAREAWSASGLEAWVGCPVRWLVERLLRPVELVPDAEPLVRGELAHAVLEEALRNLQADGSGPLTPSRLPQAREHAHAALARLAAERTFAIAPERLRTVLRRLEADVLRYLDHAAHAGSAFTPAHLELAFGGPEDPQGPVAIGEHGLRVQGRIDRVDLSPDGREALVYDYKGKSATPVARWGTDGKLQLALYLLAVGDLLGGVRGVGGLYQPLGAKRLVARGAVRDGADPDLLTVKTDRLGEEQLAGVLATALATAEQAVGEIRAGRLEPRPDGCGWRGGGCTYPSICRCADA